MTTKDEALKMAKQLRIKSSMILGGEKIAPFSECYLMEQVAKYLEALEQEPIAQSWQGLSDEEIFAISEIDEIRWEDGTIRMNPFARAIEAKLKEKNT